MLDEERGSAGRPELDVKASVTYVTLHTTLGFPPEIFLMAVDPQHRYSNELERAN